MTPPFEIRSIEIGEYGTYSRYFPCVVCGHLGNISTELFLAGDYKDKNGFVHQKCEDEFWKEYDKRSQERRDKILAHPEWCMEQIKAFQYKRRDRREDVDE